MLSVVEDFNKLKKYNIESLLGLNDKTAEKEEPITKQEDHTAAKEVEDTA
jgi:hypothetical protein